jgi:pimeloyl-ACP methyl ester carboxylesterase
MRMIDRGDGIALAVAHTPGRGPAIVFLPGYMSDMTGTKALHLERRAAAAGRGFVRFDYSGCGASQGAFAAGSIRRWAADAVAVINALGLERVLLVGSSMGGWVMLHGALALGPRVHALIGIAAAPDFTRWGLAIGPDDHAALAAHGHFSRPSDYGDAPYRYHRALIDDAAGALLLDGAIDVHCPVMLLHGMADTVVPWAVSLRLANALASADVQAVLIKDGDHRLSRDADLALLTRTLETLLEGS